MNIQNKYNLEQQKQLLEAISIVSNRNRNYKIALDLMLITLKTFYNLN